MRFLTWRFSPIPARHKVAPYEWRGAYVAQAAKPADEAKPRPVRKKRHPGGVRQAKQAWQPALRYDGWRGYFGDAGLNRLKSI
jgi:hypothetical protein